MPVLSVVQSSSMEMFTAQLIISESWSISLKILSQLALEKMKYFLGFCLMNCGRISMSVTTMAWSLIPGTDVEVFTKEGLFVNTRSSILVSLVGWLWIWVRPYSMDRSISACWTSLSAAPFLTISISHSMSGQLKSPVRIVVCKWRFV